MTASFRFGPFLIDRPGHRVLRDGKPLALPPKLFELLLLLVERAGELLTKDALLEAVWPDATVSENALAQVISDLRQALGDEPSAPQYIKTVPRRGYRFIAPVIVLDTAPLASHVRVTSSPVAGTQAGTRAPRPPGQRIAVLDFSNPIGDLAFAWLEAGLAHTLTWDLRALTHFHIVERRQVLDATAAVGSSLQAVAHETGADLLVTGSFQRSRTRIRLTARLVEVATDETLADVKVEGALDELFDLQEHLVADFARALAAPEPQTPPRARVRETTSLDAYQAFTSGWLRLESRQASELQAAADDFRRAIDLDDRYARAHTGLAKSRLAMYETTRADNQVATFLLDEATAHARKAVALDEGQAEAHAVLGMLLARQEQTTEAETEARRAIALEPGDWRHHIRLAHTTWGHARVLAAGAVLAAHPEVTFAHIQLATVHIARGDLTHAEELLRTGASHHERGRRERYPTLGLHGLLGFVHLAQRDPESALDDFERELAIASVQRRYGREYALYAHFGRGVAMLATQRAFDALTELGAALALYPEHAPANLATAAALNLLGDRTRAVHHLNAADDAIAVLAEHRPIEAALVRSQRLAVTGAPDAAIEGLERLLADAAPGPAGWTIPIEPLLASLRSHPGFAAVQRALARRAE